MVHYCQKDQQLEVKSYRIYDKGEPKAAEENVPDRAQGTQRGVCRSSALWHWWLDTGPMTALEQGSPHHSLPAASPLYTVPSFCLNYLLGESLPARYLEQRNSSRVNSPASSKQGSELPAAEKGPTLHMEPGTRPLSSSRIHRWDWVQLRLHTSSLPPSGNL